MPIPDLEPLSSRCNTIDKMVKSRKVSYLHPRNLQLNSVLSPSYPARRTGTIFLMWCGLTTTTSNI